jgi:type IV secretion system protein VirB4
VFADRIKQWLLTLRKENAAVLLVAHTLAQLDQVPATALVRAGRIGARCAPVFEDARNRVAVLPAPTGAQTIRDALLGWLDAHVQVCGALVRAAGTRDPRHVGNAAAALRNAQPFAQRYNLARRRLAERLAA